MLNTKPMVATYQHCSPQVIIRCENITYSCKLHKTENDTSGDILMKKQKQRNKIIAANTYITNKVQQISFKKRLYQSYIR